MRCLTAIFVFPFCLGVLAGTAHAQDALRALDARVVSAHPDISARIATSIGRPDAAGWIGRNRDWGGYHSVRFQYGAGRALRYGLVAPDRDVVDHAGRALRAAWDRMGPDGRFPVRVPDHLSSADPSVADRASAAAFFLSDACPAVRFDAGIVRPDPRERAVGALTRQAEVLMGQDREAPNRLLIDALALWACGQPVGGADAMAVADDFVAAALAHAREDGVFTESGGSDTSY